MSDSKEPRPPACLADPSKPAPRPRLPPQPKPSGPAAAITFSEDEPSELRWLAAPVALGLAAAISGSLALYLLVGWTGWIVGRLALVMGFWVGGAVRLGSRRQGGAICQLLAVLLTYGAITSSYTPLIAQSYAREALGAPAPAVQPAAQAHASGAPAEAPADELSGLEWMLLYALAFAAALAIPFTSDGFGLVIVFSALAVAWAMNREA